MWNFQRNEDVLILIRRLIASVTRVPEESEGFLRLEERAVNKLRAADSMVFVSRKELDGAVSSLSDKFIFHGFCSQAEDLRRGYERFMAPGGASSKEESERKIITMRLLLGLSDGPTRNFLLHPEGFAPVPDEDIIDWPAYLNEGVERWSPPAEDSTESWSEGSRSSDSSASDCDVAESTAGRTSADRRDESHVEDVLQEYVDARHFLSGCVQNAWFAREHVYMAPSSRNVDASVAVHWDDFLRHATGGLVNLDRSNMITEYKVMREILWQLWEPHTSFAFEYVGDSLLPRANVAVSSVRPEPLERFLREFLPYIELLQELRDFHASLSSTSEKIPETYRSYDVAVRNIIDPLYAGLLQIEAEVMGQESLVTLLRLADRLRKLFANARVIKSMHESVVLDFRRNSPVRCATTLLSRLHAGLLHCVDKNEQDVYLSVYLESLYKYFAVVHSWLSRDALVDLSEEFIIADENPKDPHVMTPCNKSLATESGLVTIDSKNERGHPDWQMEFALRDFDAESDGVLKVIATDVLQIGKNVHLLRLLGKLHLLKDGAESTTLHEELIARVLRETTDYFGGANTRDDFDFHHRVPEVKDSGVSFKFPAICPDDCKYPTEMDRLENLIDTSDGFLMNAFASYFVEVEEEEKNEEKAAPSLYERISKTTRNMFPAKQITEGAFVRILRERYSESGYMVKTLLTEEYRIEEHLRLLQHVYLFKDDMIFLLYRRVFHQMELNSWDSEARLTNQLQDTLANIYPEFYENCVVKIGGAPSLLSNDPLQVCAQLKIEYKIDWPLNIIIRSRHVEMYAELFEVILQIKWGLYALNHLYFDEVESKRRRSRSRCAASRLAKVLRFRLLNEFSSIQHYVLGHVYNERVRRFGDDFRRAYDLDTLIAAHDDFIGGMHATVTTFRNFNEGAYGFELLLHLVRKLSSMWNKDLKDVRPPDELKKCEALYRKCHESLNPIMYPKDISFDYD